MGGRRGDLGPPVYSGVVEHGIYVHPDAQGRGVSSGLLNALIASTEAAGIWTIQSGIFPENTASLALHARAGFQVIGTREKAGIHHGRWRDVVLLERRSRTVGTCTRLRLAPEALSTRQDVGPGRVDGGHRQGFAHAGDGEGL